MGTCLVTTLKESVTDTDLLKLGDLRFHVFKNANLITIARVDLPTGTTASVTVTHPGYITDSTGTSNLGTTKNLIGGINVFYLPYGEYDVIFHDAWNILGFSFSNAMYNGTTHGYNVGVDLEDLVWRSHPNLSFIIFSSSDMTGDLSKLAGKLKLQQLMIADIANRSELTGDLSVFENISLIGSVILRNNTKITGNVSVFADKTNLSILNLDGMKEISGNLSSLSELTNLTILNLTMTPGVTGNLSALSGLTKMKNMALTSNNGIVGNISSLSNMTDLTSLNVAYTGVTGDTSSLRNLNNLTTFIYTGTNITGTWPLT